MSDEDPLWPKVRKAWETSLSSVDLKQKTKLMENAQKIENTIVSRNLKGIILEKSGHIEKAIELYETNVRDWFDGTHPYERLRIIYTREGRFADAIRVCEAYIAHCQNDPIGKSKYRKAIDSLRKKVQR